MKRWISLRPYDRPDLAHIAKDEWVWINTHKIEMIEDGFRDKSVGRPTTLTVGGTRIRVIETPEEIFVRMASTIEEMDNGCH